jgi:hypothetical protein
MGIEVGLSSASEFHRGVIESKGPQSVAKVGNNVPNTMLIGYHQVQWKAIGTNSGHIYNHEEL